MPNPRNTVAEARRYGVLNVEQARRITRDWLSSMDLANAAELGLPEVDDRYHIWRVPLLKPSTDASIGECVIDAKTSLIDGRSTTRDVIESRILGRNGAGAERNGGKQPLLVSNLRNTIAQGDCEEVMLSLPAASVQLIFTSPPYYNARPEYTDYITYEEYLLKIRKVIANAFRLLEDGRFFVMNIAPVLIRRTDRKNSSKRIAVPFDVHRLFIEEGFDFIDDIIWVKPEGAGWATGRGRRFAADRNPLQYKAVPVTEYVLVYRKKTEKLIDWHLRNHPVPHLVKESRISDEYEKTNVWRIKPAHSPLHPAVFPVELAERVISYYSFKRDVILDPFAGIGTVGVAAVKLDRRFVLIEQNPEYVGIIRKSATRWMGKAADEIFYLNTSAADTFDCLF